MSKSDHHLHSSSGKILDFRILVTCNLFLSGWSVCKAGQYNTQCSTVQFSSLLHIEKISFYLTLYLLSNLSRSRTECGVFCLTDSLCTDFIWNSLTSTCQLVASMSLAGDTSAAAVDGFVDLTLQKG